MTHSRLNIAFVALTVAIGGFLLGFDATVISGVVPFIRDYFHLSGSGGDLRLGWAVSSLGWGAMAGNAAAGVLSDRFGRRKVLIGTALLFTLSSLLAALATSFTGFVMARIAGGLAVGGAILIAPVYIAEIAPAGKRGSLVSLNQLMIVIGISASFFSNYFLLGVGEHNWRWMLGVQMIPSLTYFLLLLTVPESPRWLLLKGREAEALGVLCSVDGEANAREHLRRIRDSLSSKMSAGRFSSLLTRRMRFIMLIALGIAFFQQITGINAIFYYLPTIFAQAGGGVSNAFRQAVMVGLVNVAMTLVAIWLIDRLGRKPLLTIGVAGMALALLTIGWAFSHATYQLTEEDLVAVQSSGVPAELVMSLQASALPAYESEADFIGALENRYSAATIEPHRKTFVDAALTMNARPVLIAIMIFVASFAISLGPVMWVLLSEIFPNEQRAAAISVVGFWNSLVSASVTFLFPWELSTFGPAGTFFIYGSFAVVALLFVLLFVPETRGRTLEELEHELMPTTEPRAGRVMQASPQSAMKQSAAAVELSRRFPDDFVWGVATSAFQIEGAASEDGKGASIWDEFCRVPGVIADGSNGDIACDHYHRLDADLDLIASLGVKAYRFSIAWPRIQPTGSGPINAAGLAFYDRLVDGLLRRNIRPYMTLYHWDLPAALQHRYGGWAARDTAYRFAEYSGLIARHFGDRVASIATHNEPWVTTILGYERGIFAPGVKNRRIAYQAAHHVLLSHALALQAIRQSAGTVPLGIVLNMSPVYAATDSDLDALHARREDGRLIRWFMDPLFKGCYPADMLEYLGADAPQIEPGDMQLISRPFDFLGINYYHPTTSSSTNPTSPATHGAAVTDMGWEVSPRSLTQLLLRLKRDYAIPALFVMENGAAYKDEMLEGRIEDEARRHYIEAHLAATADALEQGVPLKGYFVWSLLDNFEWAEGYSKRFGIVHVDYTTQRRTIKHSGHWYRGFLKAFANG